MISISEVDVAVLVGGKGSRLKNVVDDRPKPMAQLEGKPFLEWLLIYLRSLNFKKILLCTGHQAQYIENYFGNGKDLGLMIEHSREAEPLGTAGALRNAIEYISSEYFFVLNGDSFCTFDPDLVIKNHLDAGVEVTIWLVEVPDCSRFGSILLDSDGNVKSFNEKCQDKTPGLVNAGIYLLERSVIEDLPEEMPLSLEKDVFPNLSGGRMHGIVGTGPFLDIGTPDSYLKASEILGDLLNELVNSKKQGSLT